MIAITGNTYPVKDSLRAMGGRWDADKKSWMVPDEKAEQARALVAGAPAKSTAKSTSTASKPYRPTQCKVCGHVERRNSRGYVDGDKILRSGECQSCYEERKMGY